MDDYQTFLFELLHEPIQFDAHDVSSVLAQKLHGEFLTCRPAVVFVGFERGTVNFPQALDDVVLHFGANHLKMKA